MRRPSLGGEARAAFAGLRAELRELPFVDPHLHADDAVGRPRLGESVVDVAAQRVQRKAPLQVPFGPGDLGAAQTPGDANLDPLGTKSLRRLDRLSHRAPEGDALLELNSHRL